MKIALVTDIPAAGSAAPAAVDAGAAAVGAAAPYAREDHKHSITTGAPVAVGTANAGGSGSAMALANHVHQHPALAGDLHTDYVLAAGTRAFTGAQSFGLQQITNVLLEVLGALPGVATQGRVVFLSTDGHPYVAV